MLTVGRLGYLNSLPFFAAFDYGTVNSDGIEFIKGKNPVELNQLLRKKELDLSLISCSEYVKNEDDYNLITPYAIAARDKVKSVLIYIREGLSSLHGCRFGLTPESATSSTLVAILCQHFWQVEPKFEPLEGPFEQYDAFLLIGDKALHNPFIPGFDTRDLAGCWYKATGLGLPFGVFAVRKEIATSKKEEILSFQRQLQEAYRWSQANLNELLDLAQKQSTLDRPTLLNYFHTLRYRIASADLEGLKQFTRYTKQLPAKVADHLATITGL